MKSNVTSEVALNERLGNLGHSLRTIEWRPRKYASKYFNVDQQAMMQASSVFTLIQAPNFQSILAIKHLCILS